MSYHPDKNADNIEAATQKFLKAKEAYEFLTDKSKRDEYDKRRSDETRARESLQRRKDNMDTGRRGFADDLERKVREAESDKNRNGRGQNDRDAWKGGGGDKAGQMAERERTLREEGGRMREQHEEDKAARARTAAADEKGKKDKKEKKDKKKRKRDDEGWGAAGTDEPLLDAAKLKAERSRRGEDLSERLDRQRKEREKMIRRMEREERGLPLSSSESSDDDEAEEGELGMDDDGNDDDDDDDDDGGGGRWPPRLPEGVDPGEALSKMEKRVLEKCR